MGVGKLLMMGCPRGASMDMKTIVRRMTGLEGCVALVFAIAAVFQVFLITRFAPLYYGMMGLFVLLLAAGVAALVRAPARARAIALVVLALCLAVRVPFLARPTGLVLTADNAMEGVQTEDIAASKSAPFFLLGVTKHMGTIKYLLVSFAATAFGPGPVGTYAAYEIFQVLLFAAFLFLLVRALRNAFDARVLLVLAVTQLAFVETLFDYSLSLRAGTYLEMLAFIVLGIAVFDWEMTSPLRMFAAYFFLAFSVYIHPLALPFALAFFIATSVLAFTRRLVLRNSLLFLAGAAAGLYHWAFYLLFRAPRVPLSGSWEEIRILPLAKWSFRMLRRAVPAFRTMFGNIFHFELRYLADAVPAPGPARGAALGLAEALAALSFAVLVTALILAVRKAVRWLLRKEAFQARDWPVPFMLALFAAAAAKSILVFPPLLESRHNFDWVILVVLAYASVGTEILRRVRRPRAWMGAAAIALAATFTAPHYYFFLRQVEHKGRSNAELLATLREHGVRYVDTDFIAAVPIYYLSGRAIRVSDSLGPFRIREFFASMKQAVDRVPADRKAYLFYAETYPSSAWNKAATRVVRERLFRRLRESGVPFRTVRLADYLLVLPEAARTDSPG